MLTSRLSNRLMLMILCLLGAVALACGLSPVAEPARTPTTAPSSTPILTPTEPPSTETSQPPDLAGQLSYFPAATQTAEGGDGGVSLTNFRFCDVPCGDPAAKNLPVLPEAIKTIFVMWDYSGMETGMPYTREWFYEGKESWIKYNCTWQGAENGTFMVLLTEPGGLRSGSWTIVITVDGRYTFEATTEVAGSFDFWSPAGERPCKDF